MNKYTKKCLKKEISKTNLKKYKEHTLTFNTDSNEIIIIIIIINIIIISLIIDYNCFIFNKVMRPYL